MPDISITAGSVAAGTAKKATVVAGATITQGKALYKDPADSKYKLASAGSAAAAACDGIALTKSSDGQPLVVAVPNSGGTMNLGATLVVGTVYVVSPNNAGGIAPISDLASDDYPVIIGVATAADTLKFGYIDPGIAKVT